MNSQEASSGQAHEELNSEEEDDEKRCLTMHSIPNEFCPTFMSLGDKMDCRDSGLPGSSRETGSWKNSISSDPEVNEDDERGVYDYYPTQTSDLKCTESIKISHTSNPDYDEAHDVESDKSSIESPRSDASSTREYDVNPMDESLSGTEMKTFKEYQDSSDSGSENIHKSLYGSSRNHTFPYTRLSDDEEESDGYRMPTSYNNGTKYTISSHRNQPSLKEGCSLSSRSGHVDERVTFPLNKQEKFFTRDGKQIPCGTRPPFGVCDQFANVGKSINGLLSQSQSLPYNTRTDNMPEGTVILNDDGKKKKKKKKSSKDDTDNLLDKPRNDINGNPVESFSASYRQMREPPKVTEGSAVIGSSKLRSYGTINHKHAECPVTNIETFQPSKDLEDNSSSITEGKKRKKLRKEPVKLAEDIPNYVGNIGDVDDLVKYIETHNIDEKQLKKKVSQKNLSEPVKVDKAAKKTKDKKDKSDKTKTILVTDPFNKDNHSGESIAEDMGNSSDKASTTDNRGKQDTECDGTKQSDRGLQADTNGMKEEGNTADKVISSKNPPSVKKEAEIKEKNRSKSAKEKPNEIVETNKKQNKSKNMKQEPQMKNNKKFDNKPEIMTNSKILENIKTVPEHREVLPEVSNSDLRIRVDDFKSYIFTDIDSLQTVEAEFTVVSKKKKRPGVKEFPVEFPRTRNGPREYKAPTTVRSVTPPPYSVSCTEKNIDRRDLSPSAFPVLGKKSGACKGRPSFREGRRNSYGDVPVDSGLRSQDDSDIESVKSLPAAHGGRLGSVTSRLPVSYATMAAAPKPPSSPTQSPQSCDDNISSARKPTVWKGSLTERRHSIGSSPEENKAECSPKFTQRSRQKSGSQEFLMLESVPVDGISVSNSEVLDLKTDVEASSLPPAKDGFVDLAKGKPQDSSDSSSTDISSERSVTQSSSASCHCIPTITLTPYTSSVKVTSYVLKDKDLNGPRTLIKPIVSSTAEKSRSQPVCGSSCKELKGKHTSQTRITNNGRKHKSVIFLDKRFSDTPQDLDITFGFDLNFETSTPSETNIHNCLSPINAIHMNVSADSKKEKDCNQSIHSPSLVTVSVDKANEVETVESVLTKPNNSTSNKVSKARVAGLNGIVQPNARVYRKQPSSDALRTENPTSSDKIVSTKSQMSNQDKAVLVFYGDGILANINGKQIFVDSRDRKPVGSQGGQIRFVPDSISKGKFNAAEAISFLKKEWDKILELKEKNPQAVQFYCENGQ